VYAACVAVFVIVSSGHAQLPVIDLLKQAGWRFEDLRGQLPVPEAQTLGIEIQDFREYAYYGGALRVYVSRDALQVFAVLFDGTSASVRSAADLTSRSGLVVERAGRWIVALRAQPIPSDLFDTLKRTEWSAEQLDARLGPVSFRQHVHGLGSWIRWYAVAGLEFLEPEPLKYRLVNALDLSGQEPESRSDAVVEALQYEAVAHGTRRGVAWRLLEQRKQIDDALAQGRWSPDGRFTVTRVNSGGGLQQRAVRPEGTRPGGATILRRVVYAHR